MALLPALRELALTLALEIEHAAEHGGGVSSSGWLMRWPVPTLVLQFRLLGAELQNLADNGIQEQVKLLATRMWGIRVKGRRAC